MATLQPKEQVKHSYPGFSDAEYYIYFYTTKDYMYLPTIPETITDSMNPSYSPTTILGRSAPIQTYSGTGPRTLTFQLDLHRDMMWDINYPNKSIKGITLDDDYVDVLIKKIQSMAVPEYSITEKMVNPPMAAVALGKDIFIKGVVNGNVQVSYKTPILRSGKYAAVTVMFTITEIIPYSASNIQTLGSYRNMGHDLLTNQLYSISE